MKRRLHFETLEGCWLLAFAVQNVDFFPLSEEIAKPAGEAADDHVSLDSLTR